MTRRGMFGRDAYPQKGLGQQPSQWRSFPLPPPSRSTLQSLLIVPPTSHALRAQSPPPRGRVELRNLPSSPTTLGQGRLIGLLPASVARGLSDHGPLTHLPACWSVTLHDQIRINRLNVEPESRAGCSCSFPALPFSNQSTSRLYFAPIGISITWGLDVSLRACTSLCLSLSPFLPADPARAGGEEGSIGRTAYRIVSL